MKTNKRKYLSILMEHMTPDNIRVSYQKPSPYMRPIHLLLHRIAYKRKTGLDIV